MSYGYEYHIYLYDKSLSTPAGAVIKDANEILPEKEIFTYKKGFGKGSFSAFSNVFRYKLLLERGGWWVDSDVFCLKPFIEDDYVFASENKKNGDTGVASCVIKTPPQNACIKHCFKESINREKDSIVWGEIGPCLLDKSVRKFKLEKFIKPFWHFCPVNFWEFEKLNENLKFEKSYAIHFWNQMWSHANKKPNLTNMIPM